MEKRKKKENQGTSPPSLGVGDWWLLWPPETFSRSSLCPGWCPFRGDGLLCTQAGGILAEKNSKLTDGLLLLQTLVFAPIYLPVCMSLSLVSCCVRSLLVLWPQWARWGGLCSIPPETRTSAQNPALKSSLYSVSQVPDTQPGSHLCSSPLVHGALTPKGNKPIQHFTKKARSVSIS